MTRMSAVTSTLRWNARNVLSERLVRSSGLPFMRLTYEALLRTRGSPSKRSSR